MPNEIKTDKELEKLINSFEQIRTILHISIDNKNQTRIDYIRKKISTLVEIIEVNDNNE